jgi:small multidrug resistance pump
MNLNLTVGLILTIIANSIANILVKIAMSHADTTKGIIHAYALNPFFIGAIILFLCALSGFSYVLSKMKLSVAYPVIISSCFIAVFVASWLYLKESISLTQIIGIILSITGIWLVLKQTK